LLLLPVSLLGKLSICSCWVDFTSDTSDAVTPLVWVTGTRSGDVCGRIPNRTRKWSVKSLAKQLSAGTEERWRPSRVEGPEAVDNERMVRVLLPANGLFCVELLVLDSDMNEDEGDEEADDKTKNDWEEVEEAIVEELSGCVFSDFPIGDNKWDNELDEFRTPGVEGENDDFIDADRKEAEDEGALELELEDDTVVDVDWRVGGAMGIGTTGSWTFWNSWFPLLCPSIGSLSVCSIWVLVT